MSTRKLLTVQKAKEIYGVEPSLTYYWIRFKKFDHHKVGKKILFWEPDFLQFLEKHRVNKCDDSEN